MVFRRILRGSSWFPLVTKCGDSFIDKIAESYFLVTLNCLQVTLKLYVAKLDDLSVERERSDIIIGYLRKAAKIISMDSSKEGYVWRPSDVHYANQLYRQAHFFKRPGYFANLGISVHQCGS
jgi:hypothetical protein